MVAHVCNPSTREAEGQENQILGQPGLYSETLSQKQNKLKNQLAMKAGGHSM
jgi:hypothetical protein